MPAERISATYLIETPLPIEQAADVLAGEQSSGTFVAVPGETDALRERFGAKVERITELESVATPSLPVKQSASAYRRAEIVVSWSIENVGYNLPTLVSTLQGNLYELSQFSGLKLLDLDVPESVLAERRKRWTPPSPPYTSGVLAKYAALVSSASEGAITTPTPRG